MVKHQPLTSGRAATVHLIGGRVCLDFANTTSGRGTDQHLEHLLRYDDLVVWSRRTGLLSAEDAAALTAQAAAMPEAAAAVLSHALGLREALHGMFEATAAHAPVPAAAIASVNGVLAEAMAEARLRTTGHGFAWDWRTTPPGLDRMLWPIAREAAELLVSPALARVKVCPGRQCGWLFFDATKNRRRRWCDMRVCGSRDKARRHHHRKRATRSGAIA
jgi:predicted RNA-binding Zn ribbon-like protein